MDIVVPPELEELILCSCCHSPFNDTDACPKLFSCRHYFCLKCVNSVLLNKNGELYCVHCWKRNEFKGAATSSTSSAAATSTTATVAASSTSISGNGQDLKPENLPTHNAILYLAANFNKFNLNVKSKPPDLHNNNTNTNNNNCSHHPITTNTTISATSSNNSHSTTSVISATTATGSNNNITSANNNGNSATNSLNSNNNGATIATFQAIASTSVSSPLAASVSSAAAAKTSVSNVTTPQSLLANQLLAGGVTSSASCVANLNGSIPNKITNIIKKGENCMTHAMPNTLWCLKCHTLICRACAASEEHRNHTVKTQLEAKDAIRNDIATELVGMQKSLVEVQHLVLKQRDFLLKILESCTALKTQVETELINHIPTLEIAEMRDSLCRAKICLNMLEQSSNNTTCQTSTNANLMSNTTPIELYKLYSTLGVEKQRLHNKYQEMYLQCKLDDMIRNYGLLFDFELISKALQSLHVGVVGDAVSPLASTILAAAGSGHSQLNLQTHNNPILLLANYCISQLYSRHILTTKQQQHHPQGQPPSHHQQLGNLIGTGPSAASSSGGNQPQQSHSLLIGHNLSGSNSSNYGNNNSMMFGNLPPSGGESNQSMLHGHQQQSHHHPHHHLSSSTSLSNLSSSPSSSGAISIPQLSSSYGGTKSPFLDLAVGSPSSKSYLGSNHHHSQIHQFASQQLNQGHQLLGSSFSHFSDNLIMAGPFQQTNQQGNNSSILGGSSMRHSGAGGISFEMNGITVPITMISSHLPPNNSIISQHHMSQHSNNGNGQSVSSSTPSSSSTSNSSASNSIICNPTVHVYPIYYFNIEINGQPCGRILIEVRNDVAPKMAKNFGALTMGELGFGYKGCQIFQCWENESIITGDFELNNGRGGRSVFEEGFFMPDDTKILAIRGSVGMRRSQKRHDNMGLVGSQFRIILREMRGFTGIFAFVVEGLELVEKISQTGDSAGKPQSNVVIVSCGKLP